MMTNITISEINKKGSGHGSFFLKQFESYVTNVYSIKDVSLLAWQPQGDVNVVSFFSKHGYVGYDEMDRQIYDDTVTVYDLHKMRKNF